MFPGWFQSRTLISYFSEFRYSSVTGTAAFSHNSNASLKAVNDILNAGGTVSFGKSDSTIYATGRIDAILKDSGVDAKSINEAPSAVAVCRHDPGSGMLKRTTALPFTSSSLMWR